MYIKEFLSWIMTKQKIDSEPLTQYRIRAGEIRWCAMGVNIGSEIDGKGSVFTRPVLVIHVIGQSMALIVPCSTTNKNPVGYVPFVVKGKKQKLCLIHTRTISQKRLYDRIEHISNSRLEKTKQDLKQFFYL